VEFKVDILQIRDTSYTIGKKIGAFYAGNSILNQFKQLSASHTNYQEIQDLFSSFAPHLLDELEGIADGIGIQPLQAASFYSGYNMQRPQALGCSALVNHAAYVRNYDFTPDLYDHCLSFLSPTDVYGSIGYNLQLIGRHEGVNEKGLVIGLHFVSNQGFSKGLAAWTAVRIALDTCATTNQVIELFKLLPHASCYNFSVGDANGHHVVLEITPNTVYVRTSDTGLVCTNHFVQTEKYNREDVTSTRARYSFLSAQRTALMNQTDLFKLFADPASPLFFDDYDNLFGTLHTFAYSFETKRLITSLAQGALLDINASDWFSGKNLSKKAIYGYIAKKPTQKG
jgi:predicted choloylglycine hydrolase